MKIATLQQGHEPSISAVLTGLTRKPFTLTNKPVSMCLLSAFEDNVIGKNTTRVCIDLSAPINLPINCTGGGKTNLQAKKKKKNPRKNYFSWNQCVLPIAFFIIQCCFASFLQDHLWHSTTHSIICCSKIN